jgi:hypothetical protein
MNMKGMFGDRSPSTTRRGSSRERSNQKQQQHVEIQRPLAASAADASRDSVSSRRRQMAFMKYGSEKKVKQSSTSMNRMREHSRNISMQSSTDGYSPSNASIQSTYTVNTHASQRRTAFADFSTAFPGDDDDDDDEEEDLFASVHQSRARSSRSRPAANNNNNGGGFANFDTVLTAAAPPTTNTSGFANFDAVPTAAAPSFATFDQDPFSSPAAPPSSRTGASSSTMSRGSGAAVQNSPARQRVSNIDTNSTSRSGNRGMEQQQYQQRSVAQPPSQQQQQQHRQQQHRQQQEEVGFETDWPSDSPRNMPSESPRHPPKATSPPQSMSTFPSNSSMQASFVAQDSYPDESRLESKLRQPVSMVPSPSFTSSASGAAARRRMRNQMRKTPSGSHQDDASSNTGSHQELTPPQSPYSTTSKQQRYQSGDSPGSGTNGRTGTPGSSSKIADHVQHYSVQQQQQQRKTMMISSTRSIGSGSQSRGSSMESDPNMNLFDATMRPDAGMSFDAFGLDASQFDHDVNQAMQEISGYNPNLSNFVEDPADDFAAGRWDSPGASRSSTPVPEEEGFVDGFRVTKQGSNTSMPKHARQSPTASTEKSSWTSETGSEQQQLQPQQQQRLPATANGRNQFKEQAGFHTSSKPPKVIRPTRVDEARSPTRYTKSPQRTTSNGNSSTVVPRLPDLDDGQPVQRQAPSSRHQQQPQNVEFVDVESDSGRAASDYQSSSEVGAHSDVAYASDVGVSNNFAVFDMDSGDVPMEVSSKKKKKDRSDDSTGDSRAGEEKKEDMGEPTPEKTVGILRSRWEQGDAALSQGNSQPQRERQIPTPLRRDHIDNLQNQLGHEILSPEKLQQRNQSNFRNAPEPQKERVDECSEQRTSFASLKERLKSPTGRDERQYSTSKSEGGAAVRHSHANSALNRFQARSPLMESPRDAKSDAGGSPAFVAVKLRKTGFSKNDSPRGASPAEDTGTNRALNDRRESPSQSPHSRQDDGFEREHREEPQPKKPNYRERRELELQKEREEQDRRLTEEKASEASQPDVATLIKRRIATNKNTTVTPNKQSIRQDTVIPAFREKLKPVEIVLPAPDFKEDRGQSSTGDMGSNTMPSRSEHRHLPRSPLASHKPREADLVFEEAGASKKPVMQQKDVSAPSSAVSRMVMLEQLQQRQPRSEEHSMPPPSPVKDNNRTRNTFDTELPSSPVTDSKRMGNALAIETAISADADSDDVHSRTTPKATTPKATMMMLNAFLSGRESIASADGAIVAKADQSESHHHDAGGTDTVEPSPATATPAVCIPTAVKDDPQYERFFRMLKIGMPLDVVKHAMIRDGVDPSVMDGDPNKPAGVPLKDNPTYKKYFKMLGFGLPMEAVKHAMERDGLDSTVMDNDHEMPINAPNQTQEQEQDVPIEKDSHRRARLHWKPLRKVTSNSLWAKIDQEIDNIEIDEEEFQELFQVEKNASAAPVGASATKIKRGSSVRVIDAKRANNGGIVLARLKMSHDDMADAVDRIDENALTAEQIENIVEYLPTKVERRSLEAYMLEGGQDAAEKFEGLCECEKFMVSMMTVKHAKRKVRALLFKLQFESCLEDIHNDTVAIESACDELSDSTRLRQLFGFILTFGNRLNMAGSGSNVNTRKTGAFSLDSLLKLHQAKAFDKKTTFLHYLVLIVQRNNELLLNFKDDLPTVFKADKVFWDQCLTDLEEVENQLENVRKIALYQAHQARQARIYQVRRRKQRDDDGNESLSEGEASLTLEEEVEALRATPVGLFTLSAIKYVSSLRDRIETTKSKFFRLLEYFGEEDKKKQPHELFSTIVAFSRDFDKEKEKVFAKQKSDLREERKRQAKESKVQNGKPPPRSPVQPERPLRSSNMQPSMSSVLAEMKVRSPAVEPKPVLSPVREVVAQESPACDRYNDPHVRQNNYSNSNLAPKSPRSSSRYTDESLQKSVYSNPGPENPMPGNRYDDGSVQQNNYSNAPPKSPRMNNRRNDESVQESSYSNPAARSPESSNHYNGDSRAATPHRSTDKESLTPNRTPSFGNASSQPMQAPFTTGQMNTETNRTEAPPSTPVSARTATAMRQKARLRRQRMQTSPSF